MNYSLFKSVKRYKKRSAKIPTLENIVIYNIMLFTNSKVILALETFSFLREAQLRHIAATY